MEISVAFRGTETASAWKLLTDLAPHIFWGLVILAVILIIGPARIRDAFANAKKIGFGGFEIELKSEIAELASAKNIPLPPQLRDQLARRAERLRPLVAGARILWVDDCPSNNEQEMALLNRLGMAIDFVVNEAEARQALSHAVYDLVLSDIRRGTDEKAGIEILDDVKVAVLRPPVIFYVGKDRDVPRGAFGLTNRFDTLLHLAFDALERKRG